MVILNAGETQTGLAVGYRFVLIIWMLYLDHKLCCCWQLRLIIHL